MCTISWTENDESCSAHWHSENSAAPPDRVVVVDDRTSAQSAHRMIRAGTGLLWRGDFHNARQLMSALDRRLKRSAGRGPTEGTRRRCSTATAVRAPSAPNCSGGC